ncbi:helix-turn-helix domain-containing protein [Staphylococcus simulans]|uniref:helix-turn-helix domain-containing protein n=1 Tax=Staphylococcus simulans TaxID=1286 RepID=UPI00131A177E|nr:XRE family transcriptional regulator [Staphylococcus simulans]
MFAMNIKKLRKEQSLTLEKLSSKCNVSKSMLSKIERGEKQPTIKVAAQIASGLNTTVSNLLGEAKDYELIIIKKEEQPVIKNEKKSSYKKILSPTSPSKTFEFSFNEIGPNECMDLIIQLDNRKGKYIYLQKGELQLIFENKSSYTLNEGDAIYFDGKKDCKIKNFSEQEVTFYSVESL